MYRALDDVNDVSDDFQVEMCSYLSRQSIEYHKHLELAFDLVQ